jgi:tetratricopeptide (TPR) repeat protein
LGKILTYVGRTEEAIDYLEKAGRSDPLNLCNRDLGNAYREAGRYEEAIAEYKKCVKNQVIDIFVHECMALTYALAGRYEEAREAWSEVKRIDPTTTPEKMNP